jgi:hypothetical protein
VEQHVFFHVKDGLVAWHNIVDGEHVLMDVRRAGALSGIVVMSTIVLTRSTC